MSNRLLWILIIIWFVWVGYLYYHFSYLPNKKIEIQSQIIEKQIQDQNKEKQKKELKLVEKKVEKIELSNEQKIEEIKQNNTNYKTFTLENGVKSFFKKNNNNLDLYIEDYKIWNFDLVYPEFLKIDLIKWTQKDLYIEIAKDKFYYNSDSKVVSKIDLDIDVLYVKSWNNGKLIFVTSKWSFDYSIKDKILKYFSYFNDYVYFEEWYVWLVKKDDERILNNLWYETNQNLLVYYNPITKEKTIISKTDLEIVEIYTFNDSIFLLDNSNKVYGLENVN